MRRTALRRARVYHTLRTAHLERARAMVPASLVYGRRNYDFDESLAEGLDLVPASRLSSAALVLIASDLDVVEVNEPLMRVSLGRTAVAVAAVRAAGALRRRRVRVVTYAIENRDPFAGPAPTTTKGRVRARLERRLARLVARRVDRIAYGTQAAQGLYRDRLGPELAQAASALVPALPVACSCPEGPGRDPDGVVFVGALQERKGFPLLVAAWPEVVRRWPAARLTIVGKGALEPLARDLAGTDDTVELLVDPPRETVHRVLRRAGVLVLLSQPAPTWREQVGLPIVEALSHGCSVVTTAQTGLAGWLADHGHAVLAPGARPSTVAAAVAGLLAARRPAADVIADLPEVDGRLAADAWLLGVDDPPVRTPG